MGSLSDFEILMPDRKFSETYEVDKVIELGLIYLNTLSPDMDTGKVPYEADHWNLSPELRSFITVNKEKPGTRKIYSLDEELHRANKLQKISNDYLFNKNSREGKKARLLEKNIDLLSLRIPRTPYGKGQENTLKTSIMEKLDPFDEVRLMTVIESLHDSDFNKTVNGVKLVVTNSVDGFDLNPLPLQFYCYTDDPIRISINLCNVHFEKKGISVEFKNEFRSNIFHSLLNSLPDSEIITKFLVKVFSEKEADKGRVRGITKKRETNRTPFILQLRVSIKGISPPIWRKLLVSSSTSLHDLHLMIQAAFGWYNYHLYEFSFGYDRYSRPGDWDEPDDGALDSTHVTLEDLNVTEGNRINYLYDFGDDWEHAVSVQKILQIDTSVKLPACIGGKRNGPPEDCGGTYGYREVLEKAKDPNDPEHAETVEWLGEYDPEEFDLDYADTMVKNYKEMEFIS